MAGESARAIAADKRKRGEALLREADQYDRGAAGEEATAAVLATLPCHEWSVTHDVHWPGRAKANVDHVLVGPSGVYVIDSKNWRGRVALRDGHLTRDGRSCDHHVESAQRAALDVAGLVPSLDPRLVRSVLCVVTDDDVSGTAAGVTVCTVRDLVAYLAEQPPLLSARRWQRLAHDLGAQLWPATGPVPAGTSRTPAWAATTPTARPLRPARPSRSRPPAARRGRSALLRLAPLVAGLAALVAMSTHPEAMGALGAALGGVLAR